MKWKVVQQLKNQIIYVYYLVRLGGAGAVFPRLFVGRLSCTRLPLTGPPNVERLRSTCVTVSI